MNSVHYEKGSENEIAFIFSCPGQKEEKSTPPGPAKGQTGVNLEVLLEILSLQPETNGICREKITITNAWPRVEYKKATGRSEATKEEILDYDNIDRLAKELITIKKYIFVSGKKAEIAVMKLIEENKLKNSVRVFKFRHLGNQSLNQIKEDKNGEEIKTYSKAFMKPKYETRSLKQIRKDNTRRRIEKVAYDLYRDIETGNSLQSEKTFTKIKE